MKILVIIPTYNEADNIRRLIPVIFAKPAQEVAKAGHMLEVLVVDDNSPDGTSQVVEKLRQQNERIHLITRPQKKGLGRAYLAGFHYALEHDYDYIFEMDADFSHDPHEIPKFIAKMVDHDLVLGSRYCNGISVVNWPLKRLILSLVANYYVRIVTGLPLLDNTTGFKCIHRRVLESIDLDRVHSDGYSFQIEINWHAHQTGFPMCTVPIIFVDRHAGSSKMSHRIIIEAILMVWKLRFGF